MKKILFSLMTLVLVIGLTGAGAFAVFTDTEISEGNVFTAGTLNLKLNDADGVLATWTHGNMAPGDTVSGTINLKNAGSLDGTVNVDFSAILDETGTPEGVTPVGSDVIGDKLRATTVTLAGATVSGLEDKSVNDLVALGSYNLGDLNALADADFYIAWTLDLDSDNGVQGDSAEITLTFMLDQK